LLRSRDMLSVAAGALPNPVNQLREVPELAPAARAWPVVLRLAQEPSAFGFQHVKPMVDFPSVEPSNLILSTRKVAPVTSLPSLP
jgi:hypothetical protein